MNTLPALLLAAVGVGFGHAVLPDHWLPLAVLSRTRGYRTTRVARLSLAAAIAHVLVSVALGAVLVLIGLQFRATVARHTDLAVGVLLSGTGLVFLVLDMVGKGHGHSHDGEGHGHSHDHGHGHDHGDGHAHGTHAHGHHDHSHHDHSHHDHESDHGRHDRDHGHGHPSEVEVVIEVEEIPAGHGHPHAAVAVLERPEHGDAHARTATPTDVPIGDRPRKRRSPRGLAGLLIPFGAAASPDLTILPVFLAAGALGAGAALGTLAAFTVATVGTIVGLTVATAAGARLLTAPWIDRRANLITALTLVAIGGLVAGGVI